MNIGNVAERHIVSALEQEEGRNVVNGRHLPYKDSLGILTVGYGRNLQTRGLSEEEAQHLLLNDIQDHWRELVAEMPWVQNIDPVRQEVLLDMAFNMGVPRLLGFEKMLDYVQAGKFDLAGAEMLDSKWAVQVMGRASYLADAMVTGKFAELKQA